MHLAEHKIIHSSAFPKKKKRQNVSFCFKTFFTIYVALKLSCKWKAETIGSRLHFSVWCSFFSAMFICLIFEMVAIKTITFWKYFKGIKRRNCLQCFIPACIIKDVGISITEALKLHWWTYRNEYMMCDSFWKRSVTNYKFLFGLWITVMWNSLPREVVKCCVLSHWQMNCTNCLKALQKADLRRAVVWTWWHSGVPMSRIWLAFWQLYKPENAVFLEASGCAQFTVLRA